jgi:hypothetical protein
VEQVLSIGVVYTVGEGKGYRRVNMVQICVHMYVYGKMIPVATILGIWEEGIKDNGGGGEFKYDIFYIL